MQHGTDGDKANLPVETSHRNQPREQHGRRKGLTDGRRQRVRRRVNQDCAPQSHNRAPQAHDDAVESMTGNNGVDDADDSASAEAVPEETAVQPPQGGVLPRAHLSDAARARAVEIEDRVAGEVADEMRERREEATRIRRNGVPDGHGGTLYMLRR